jgi:hypothetical protein
MVYCINMVIVYNQLTIGTVVDIFRHVLANRSEPPFDIRPILEWLQMQAANSNEGGQIRVSGEYI